MSVERIASAPKDLNISPFRAWDPWFLLTAGDLASGEFNPMTVSWGTMGHIWGKDLVQVVVRPQRYTKEFMEKYDTFTLCAFDPVYRPALSRLGTQSGRDIDKRGGSGLTPIASSVVAAPSWAESELTIECRKVCFGDFDPAGFADPGLEAMYPIQDYHRFYFGEIVAVQAVPKYLAIAR